MPKRCQRLVRIANRNAKGRQNEGRAKSLFYLASTLKKVTWKIKHVGAKISQRKPKEMPNNAKKHQKTSQRQPKGSKREARGSPGGGATRIQKHYNIEAVFGKRFWDAHGRYREKVWGPFRFILGAKFYYFSYYFLALFFIDLLWLLYAFWKAFWVALGGHFGYFFRLCEKSRTPRNHRPCR